MIGDDTLEVVLRMLGVDPDIMHTHQTIRADTTGGRQAARRVLRLMDRIRRRQLSREAAALGYWTPGGEG